VIFSVPAGFQFTGYSAALLLLLEL